MNSNLFHNALGDIFLNKHHTSVSAKPILSLAQIFVASQTKNLRKKANISLEN